MADEAVELLPRTAGAAEQDSLERGALIGVGDRIDDQPLRPVAVDHPLRRIEGDEGAQAAKRDGAEGAVIESQRPVALAAIVRAELTEVHVPRADQGAHAVFEDEPLGPPRRRLQRRIASRYR